MSKNASVDARSSEDIWISSVCSQCYSACSILAHKVDGVVVKIEGNPESPVGAGRLCAKGASGIMLLYDPNRLRTPLKRTNPEKGIGVDPGWVPISWEDALDTVAGKLRDVREDDPRKLMYQHTTTMSPASRRAGVAFSAAFGSPNLWAAGGGLHCGNGAHLLGGIFHASWSIVPDFRFCEYVIYFGCSKGHSAGHAANITAQQAADARARGIHMVVVDPMCSFAASKATEWIPILPGTDGALALAMCNVIVNELETWDDVYLRRHTNGPYLIRPDGLYMRDNTTNKPLVWDPLDGCIRTFDEPKAKDCALLGKYQVEGVECSTAFDLLKEHLRKFTPEWAEKWTSIQASIIRRIATEFAEAARIGSTITIDGVSLPFRPASAIYFRGAQGHSNSTYTCASIVLLNQIVGSADVPGGTLGFNPVSYGHPETGKPYYVPKPCPDGLMITGTWLAPHLPYPQAEPGQAQSIGLLEMHPFAMFSPTMASADQEVAWRKFRLPYRPEILLNCGANSIMSVGNPSTVAESLKKFKFIVSFDIYLNEFTDFADIVFPDFCYLERYDPMPNPGIFGQPAGLGDWSCVLGQPVVENPLGTRQFSDVMMDLAERVGIREETTTLLNVLLNLDGKWKLDPQKSYLWEEVCDRVLRNNFGEKYGLEWFKENGVIKWPKRVEEVYWRPFIDVRMPVYLEFIQATGKKVQEVAGEQGIDLDTSHYTALPEWVPCHSHKETNPDYGLFAFYYRDTLHTNSLTYQNPWLDEAAQMNPYSYKAIISEVTAGRKGIKDGDLIWIQSPKGRRVEARVKVSQAIHPECLGVAGCAGHWSKNQPIAKGKGVLFNELLDVDLAHVDPINLNLDLCVRVKIGKA